MILKKPRWPLLGCLFVYFLFTCQPIWAQTLVIGSLELTQIANNGEGPNYVFLPGGPGISSDYFKPLTSRIRAEGTIWHLDYPDKLLDPSDGPERILQKWKSSLIEVAKSLPSPVFIGHSFGGMLILDIPKLKNHLKGVVLLSTSPVSDMSTFLKSYSSPVLMSSYENYQANKTRENLKKFWLYVAPVYFNKESEQKGFELLKASQYFPIGDRSFELFISQYSAQWIPEKRTTVIITGDNDKVEPIDLYDKMDGFSDHVKDAVIIKNAGHFPWVENLEDTVLAFESFFKRF